MMPRMAELRTPIVPSVKRAIAIIETLSASERGMTVSAVSRKLGIPKSTGHVLMLTLRSCGYLKCDESTGRYQIGIRLLEVASARLRNVEIHEVDLRPELRTIVQQSGLTAHCAVLEEGQPVYVAKVDTPGMIKLATWVGRRMEAHCTAVGKAILAYLQPEELDVFLRQRRLPRHTEKTIHTHEELRRELEKVRNCGYSYEDEEFGLGVRCIGAPVFNAQGRVIAAVSASGTSGQINKGNVDQIRKLVVQAAKQISYNIACNHH